MSKSTPMRISRDELLNAWSHGLGALLSLTALVYSAFGSNYAAGSASWLAEVTFTASLLLLYLASTIYHSVQDPVRKKSWRIIDHMSIYVLIAGTYTPFLTTAIAGSLGEWMLWVIWAIAITGIVFKATLGFRFPRISLLFYLAMGWMVVVIYDAFIAQVAEYAVLLVALGGLFYTGGTLFFVSKKIPYAHFWWHLCVLAGSASHYFAVKSL